MSDRPSASNPGIGDVLDLVKQYAKQETIDPLKGLGRYLAWGIAGSLLLAIGFLMLALSMLRALQTSAAPHFDGHLSWLPYFFTVLAAGVVIALSLSRIGKGDRRKENRR